MDRVSVNDVRFALLAEGRGPLVLLLHGFPDTAHTWDAVRPALAGAGFRAVAPFMRGYAPTSIPTSGAYDIETLGRDALGLIDALGEEQAIVVGHDWGAAAAFAAAALDPARVRRLITVAVPHPASLRAFSPRLIWGARHFIAFQSRGAERRIAADDFALIDALVRRWSPAWRPPEGETRPVKEVFRQPGSLTAALGYYRAVGLRPPAILRRKITVPSAAFSGAEDGTLRLADYERARRWYAAPHEIVHMPGGHFLHREHPERFTRELLLLVC
jgi:pimeloyl-ACP methyl ester carboxylesterase